MKFTSAILLWCFLFVTTAHATEYELGSDEATNVFVWIDQDALKKAIVLIDAKIYETNPRLLYNLMSCMVPKGTKAVLIDSGIGSSKIIVTDGEMAGCEGLVINEDLID